MRLDLGDRGVWPAQKNPEEIAQFTLSSLDQGLV
jgi:hypothetical protein